jgi:uncharacterized membrane protein HdeD (DUF308 family)
MATDSASNQAAGVRSAGGVVIAAGAISIVMGLLAIFYPELTLLALAIFAGINLILLSALSLFHAFSPDADASTRALSAVLGVLGLIAGLVVLRRPGETLLALVLVLGIWLVVSGVVHFLRALARIEDRAVRMLVAICEVVLGVLILSVPDLSLRTLAIFAGIGFILRGSLEVYAGVQLRKLGSPEAGGRGAT